MLRHHLRPSLVFPLALARNWCHVIAMAIYEVLWSLSTGSKLASRNKSIESDGDIQKTMGLL